MKKKISLIVAMAMLISAFVSFASVASAATNPQVVITATEVDFTDAAYSAYANNDDIDWRAYAEDSIGGEYKTYDVAVALTGLELEVTQEGTGRSAKYPGTSLISAALTFSVAADGLTAGTDYATMVIDTLVSGASSADSVKGNATLGVGDTNSTAIYPAAKEVKTVVASDVSPAIFHALVTVDSGVSITLSLSYADIVIGTYTTNNTASRPDATTEYTSDNGSFVLSGSLTLPKAGVVKIETAEAKSNLGVSTGGLKDRDGEDVTLTKNYGITKFSPTLNTATKNYFINAKDSEGNEMGKKALNFAQQGIEGKATFYVIIKSTGHVISDIWIEEEDAE
jgi:hypothetical protein